MIHKTFINTFEECVQQCNPSVDLMLIKIQPDATVCRFLFTAKSLYMFRVLQHPSSGVLKTALKPPVQVIILEQLLPSNVA